MPPAAAACSIGDAQVSEMHCNFLINLGSATAADIETLGETVRAARARDVGRRARMGNQADRRRGRCRPASMLDVAP